MLQNKEIDMALAFKPSTAYEELESVPLFRNSLSAVMRREHPMASHQVLTMEELENHRIILPGKGLQARRAFDRYLGLDSRKRSADIFVEMLRDSAKIERIAKGLD